MTGFKIVKEGVSELEIKRSRFIAFSCPIKDDADAESKLAEIRKKHYGARHVCYAYVCDELGQRARFSDDGEPSGTAGKPILEVIKNNDLKKSMIAVVRYFGGILLGAGGLTRAYSDSASNVVKNVGYDFMEERDVYEVESDYSTYKKITPTIKKSCEIVSVEYGSGVCALISCEKGFPVAETLAEAGAGKVRTAYVRTEYFKSENR